jgi:DNA helicase IV
LSSHPEFEAEQRYIEHAYACLERMRASARLLQYSVETGAGGTHQARFERDVVEDQAMVRLARLQLGAESLVFGRVDHRTTASGEPGERFYIGRLPISDAEQEPVVVDWRAPMAESFYRATGRNPLGLERRRHFATDAEVLLGIDDEVFTVERLERDGGSDLVGSGALLAALGRARTGHMRDIVATIQSEQDEIIRSELPGVLVVQGGPGTGKTAVALHRASYLLYTHRFPLERQGVLVVGPNRMFIRYISRVLPGLGETGVDLYGVDDFRPDVRVNSREGHAPAKVKGDLRMAKVIKRAVLTRQRGLREGLKLGFGINELSVSAAETAEMVAVVKRSHRVHNASRKHLQSLLVERLYARYRDAMLRTGRDPDTLMAFADFSVQLKRNEVLRLALDRMWPLLSPQMLIRDLFGAQALIRAAGRDILSDAETEILHRPRGASMETATWTSSDIPLLDEAAQLLGPLPIPAALHAYGQPVDPSHDDGLRTYGHIIIDEAQDLSPMQLRMVARRSLSGSMTVVGDIGQATGMWAPKDWDQVLSYLPSKRPPRLVTLSVGYRTPAEVMAMAARVLAVAAPGLIVPRSVRTNGHEPEVIRFDSVEEMIAGIDLVVARLREALGLGTIAVLCPDEHVDSLSARLSVADVELDPTGLTGEGVTVLPVRMAKGLEFDGVIVVEPAEVASDSAQGLRALFVALTRATRELVVVHSAELPDCMKEPVLSDGASDHANGNTADISSTLPSPTGVVPTHSDEAPRLFEIS